MMRIKTLKTRLNATFFQVALIVLMLLQVPAIQAKQPSTAQTESDGVFARIDDQIISLDEFSSIFRAAVRHKYYHGRVPEIELEKFRKKVAEETVLQILLYREAQKKGLQPDHEKIQLGLDEYDRKYANSLEWKEQKEKVSALLFERLERENLIGKIRAEVRVIESPEASEIEQYYRNNPNKFTEPARLWLSVILLSVPPSSDAKTWQDANEAALQFKQRIENGAEFSATAKKYSAHPSAVNGGDLGYLHQGMLEGDAQTAVKELTVNQLSEPVTVLEGITLFRLNGIQPEILKPFTEVAARAEKLLFRERKDDVWNAYTRSLIESADIYINENLYVLNDD